MEIVDAQLHPDRMGPHWREASAVQLLESTVTAMDAVGVHAVVLDEWAGWTTDGRSLPGCNLPNGARRTTYEVAELAVATYPDRFAYAARFDYRDPELSDLIATLREYPGRRALRWIPTYGHGGILTSENGPVLGAPEILSAYKRYFALAQEHDIPVFVVVPDQSDALQYFIRRFENLQFVVDHCGLAYPTPDRMPEHPFAGLERVIALARYPNVSLKWSHALRLSTQEYPYRDVLEQFETVLTAFGPRRLMWASDHTEGIRPSRPVRTFSWAETLYYLLDCDLMSQAEKQWIFGGNVRHLLGWPRMADEV